MKKKISILIIAVMAIITLLPLGSAFAYSGGLLNGIAMKIGSDHTNLYANLTQLTDNNLTTYALVDKNGSNTDTVWYEFSETVSITDIQLKSSDPLHIRFYDSSGALLSNAVTTDFHGNKFSRAVSNVKKVAIANSTTSAILVYEFDVFGTGIVSKSDVTNLTATNITDTSATLTWDNPTDSDFSTVAIHKEDGSMISNFSGTSKILDNLNPETNYTYTFISHYNDGSKSSGKTVAFTTLATPEPTDIEPPGEITGLTTTTTTTGATFNWNNPADSDFAKVNIYRDGSLIGSSTNGTYTVSGLTQGTEYNYTFKTVDSAGNESTGTTKTIKTQADSDGDGITDNEDIYPDDPENTPKPAGEVQELVITPEYNKVKLSWKLPGTTNFKNVTIYRDVISQETGLLDSLLGKKVYAAALFETNGTTFTDLTVEPETEYKYTVTTTSLDGIESTGVTGTTATPKKPLLADMSLPFSVNELVGAGNELLWLIGPFVLLGMSFLLFPKLRKLIMNSFRNNRKEVAKDTKDMNLRRFRTDEKETKEKHEGKEHIEKMDKLQKERQEREKREREARAAEPKIKEPRAPKESKRERRRAEKQTRIGRAAREPRAPRESARAAREPRRKRGAS